MKYILDFDGVLFDTEAFKQKMEESGISESERGLNVFKKIMERDPDFKMESLVFPNALEFLREYGKDCIVVSSASSVVPENNTDIEAQKEFQMKKIVLSGVGALVHDIRVVDTEKSEVLRDLQNEHDGLLFVDDRQRYIKEAHALGIKSVWMDRAQKGYLTSPEGVPTMLEFQRVGNFAEFISYIKSCKLE